MFTLTLEFEATICNHTLHGSLNYTHKRALGDMMQGGGAAYFCNTNTNFPRLDFKRASVRPHMHARTGLERALETQFYLLRMS